MTDRKLLVSIFSANRSLPTILTKRIIHYINFLQSFDYIIKCRDSQSHGNEDVLLHLPLNHSCENFSEADGYNMSQFKIVLVTASDIVNATELHNNL